LEMSLTLSRIVITMLIIPLYVIGNYYAINSSNTIGRTLFYFERPMTPLGLGAIWFSAGLLIAAGTVTTTAMLATVVFISTIGDPLATIVGSNIKSPRLPYNKRKSIAGFSAILISSALFAYFMVGAYGISLGVLSAVLESLSLHPIDDNFLVPTVLSIAARMV
ncbi:MAG: dolichol kinase, partial [Thermoplasmataceae archaeon]